jgi:hypothetical protein
MAANGEGLPTVTKRFDAGLVLILKELHDKLDAADACDCPVGLSNDEILVRLVALNKERAKEEARGFVRWLLPKYQVPRFGTPREMAELELVGGGGATREASTTKIPKPAFPTNDQAQTVVVVLALANAVGPLDAVKVAAGFKQGQRVAPKSRPYLPRSRVGSVSSVDGGQTFALRRAA